MPHGHKVDAPPPASHLPSPEEGGESEEEGRRGRGAEPGRGKEEPEEERGPPAQGAEPRGSRAPPPRERRRSLVGPGDSATLRIQLSQQGKRENDRG